MAKLNCSNWHTAQGSDMLCAPDGSTFAESNYTVKTCVGNSTTGGSYSWLFNQVVKNFTNCMSVVQEKVYALVYNSSSEPDGNELVAGDADSVPWNECRSDRSMLTGATANPDYPNTAGEFISKVKYDPDCTNGSLIGVKESFTTEGWLTVNGDMVSQEGRYNTVLILPTSAQGIDGTYNAGVQGCFDLPEQSLKDAYDNLTSDPNAGSCSIDSSPEGSIWLPVLLVAGVMVIGFGVAELTSRHLTGRGLCANAKLRFCGDDNHNYSIQNGGGERSPLQSGGEGDQSWAARAREGTTAVVGSFVDYVTRGNQRGEGRCC